MSSNRNRFLPNLCYDHPGFFKVAVSLVLIHLGLTFDSLQPGPRHSPGFTIINGLFGNQLWPLALIHLVIAGLVVAGMYWRGHFNLLRYGCVGSLVLFNTLAVAFAYSSYLYHLSYYAAIASVTLSLSSLAALREPPVQAAWRE
jgi:hypothetical protein